MKFTIIATSDIHGHAERFSKLAQQIKQKQPTLLIDNGDFLQGSHLSYFYERVKKAQHPLIAMANELHYDVAIFGNHEFNYPLEKIEEMRSACNFPWIAANIGNFSAPYIMKEIDGVRIAVVGVVTHHVPLWDDEGLTKDLTFTDALSSAKQWVQFVREHEQPDLIILCYHGGFERDVETKMAYDDNSGENQGYEMLQQIDGIDIFITGHQHLQIATKVNGVSVVQPGSNAYCAAQIDVTLENGVLTHEPSLLFVDEDLPATTFTEMEEWLDITIGHVDGDMTYKHFLQPRLADHPYLHLLHQVQLEATGAQISVTELFYNETGGFSGNVTIHNVLHNYPRTNTLNVVKLSGADIREALELCAAVFAVDVHGDIGLSSIIHYPELHPYVYDAWSGIDYELNVSRTVGSRVTKLLYNGEPVHDDQTFEVVVNSYRWTGAHGFMMMHKPIIRDNKTDLPRLIMEYFRQYPGVTPIHKQQWRIVKD